MLIPMTVSKRQLGSARVGPQQNFRPIVSAREIKAGRDKGKFEVFLPPHARQRRYVVMREDIRRFPGEDDMGIFRRKRVANVRMGA